MTYLQTLKLLFTNENFVLLLVSYGVNVGVFYVVSTLLNQMLLPHFPVSSAAIVCHISATLYIEALILYSITISPLAC